MIISFTLLNSSICFKHVIILVKEPLPYKFLCMTCYYRNNKNECIDIIIHVTAGTNFRVVLSHENEAHLQI